MIFSNGEGDTAWGWSNAGFMLVATILSIVFATLINNLSTQRQYPNYWGIRGPTDCVINQVDNFVNIVRNYATGKCCMNSSSRGGRPNLKTNGAKHKSPSIG